MPYWIRVNPPIILRLEVRQHSPRRDRVLPGFIKIVDLDVQVHHHHLLVLRVGGPRRSDEVILDLETDSDATVRIGQGDPGWFVGPNLPAQQQPVLEPGLGERLEVGPQLLLEPGSEGDPMNAERLQVGQRTCGRAAARVGDDVDGTGQLVE